MLSLHLQAGYQAFLMSETFLAVKLFRVPDLGGESQVHLVIGNGLLGVSLGSLTLMGCQTVSCRWTPIL